MPTTYYIRKTGSDSNAGTSAGAAWLTFGKALGASGISSGDTVYVGAGVYRETVSIAMSSAVAETKVIGDVDGVQTGDAGEVQLTGYTTNDTTAPSSTTLLDLNGKSFLTFQDIVFISGNALLLTATTATSTDIKLTRCLFVNGFKASNGIISHTTAANVTANWVIDSCMFMGGSNTHITITATRPATADFDIGVLIKNCFFHGGAANGIAFTTTGANTFKPGGGKVYNCTYFGSVNFVSTNNANIATSIPTLVYNNVMMGGTTSVALLAATLGQITEDYNLLIWAGGQRTSVTAGAHSISDGSYAPLFFTGHEFFSVGANLRPFGMPKSGSPLTNFGNQAGSPTVDILGTAKQLNGSIGCYEYGPSGVREISTVRTGANALKLAGPGYQDFAVPVNGSVSTTINIYARYDSNYAGTLPSMNIVNGTEAGVSNATATQAGAVNTWEQLSLIFTPMSNGIITVRLLSSSTASNGNAFFDDFSVT